MVSKVSSVVGKRTVAGLTTLLASVSIAYPFPSIAQIIQRQPTVAPTLRTPAPQAPVQPPLDYTLGGGDRIRINVFEVPEYSGDYQVPPGGALYLPLVGGITILGLTQEQAAEAIAARYSRYLRRPLVTVSLLSPRPINVVVAGEVNRPGSYTVGLQGGAGDNPGVQYPTIVGALTLSEGVTLAADIRQVQLRRRQGLGPETVTTLDLTQLIQTGVLPQDITLRDGDTIYVPVASEVNLAEIRQFSTASFAGAITRPRTVTVVGEVNRPGSYTVIGGSTTAIATEQGGGGAGGGLPTVSRAIQLAGGINSLADVRGIQLRRPTKSGTEQTLNLNFWQLLTGDSYQDTLIQDGDTIVIPTVAEQNPAESTVVATANFSPATIRVSVIGEVKRATGGAGGTTLELPANTPLNQAILAAGGFNDSRARRTTVDLIRLNPNGSVTKRQVKINLAQGISEEVNPILRNNDIVVINRSFLGRVGDTIGAVGNPLLNVFSIFRLFGL